MANEINYSFENPLAKPLDEYPESYAHDKLDVSHPPQDTDSEEYLCGSAGNAHPYANAGRDQDRSRQDEYQGASPFARYVS